MYASRTSSWFFFTFYIWHFHQKLFIFWSIWYNCKVYIFIKKSYPSVPLKCNFATFFCFWPHFLWSKNWILQSKLTIWIVFITIATINIYIEDVNTLQSLWPGWTSNWVSRKQLHPLPLILSWFRRSWHRWWKWLYYEFVVMGNGY